jgi:hypothetical protein
MPDDNDSKPVRGRPFLPGTSGNSAGRPRGARNRMTLLAEALLEGDAKELMQKALELARNGEKTLLGKFVDRLVPRLRERHFELPPVNSGADRAAAIGAVLAAAAAGEITVTDAKEFVKLIDVQIEAIGTSEVDRISDEVLQKLGSGIPRLVTKSNGTSAANSGASEINGSAPDDAVPEMDDKSVVHEAPKKSGSSAGADVAPKNTGASAGHDEAPKTAGASPGDNISAVSNGASAGHEERGPETGDRFEKPPLLN